MDPITHGLLGVTTSNITALRKLGRPSWMIGALAAMAPDLDVFIHSKNNPLLTIYFHRHFTHSLLFIPIGGLIVGLFCLLLMPIFRQHYRLTLCAAVLAYGTHGLLDACTSYGTLLMWPFNYTRFAWDWIAIVDPIFTVILLLGIIAVFSTYQLRYAWIALFAALVYLFGVGGYQHAKALHYQKQLAQQRQHNYLPGRAMPQFGNLITWNSIYHSDDQIYLDKYSIAPFKVPKLIQNTHVTWFNPNNLPLKMKQDPILARDFAIFNWFTDGYITAFNEEPLVIGDLRYTMSLNPLVSLWGIDLSQTTPTGHVTWLHPILVRKDIDG